AVQRLVDLRLLLVREAALRQPAREMVLHPLDLAVHELLEGLRLHREGALVTAVMARGGLGLRARRQREHQRRGSDEHGSELCERLHGFNLQRCRDAGRVSPSVPAFPRRPGRSSTAPGARTVTSRPYIGGLRFRESKVREYRTWNVVQLAATSRVFRS